MRSERRQGAGAVVLVLLASAAPSSAEDGPAVRWPDPSRTLAISAPFRGEPIRLRVSSRTAGAIDSLTWRGQEYVNSFDHGRELQSAAFLDSATECENPTEAGSAADGSGETSTSVLLSVEAGAGWLETRSRMAHWVPPGQKQPGCEAGRPSADAVSDTGLHKRVVIGADGVPNAIRYEATFEITSAHGQSTFEVLTGYMPPTFSRFLTFDPADGTLRPLSPGPGEQALPVILATPDGSHAMGLWGLDRVAAPGASGPSYGRWRFDRLPGDGVATNKSNCVYREPRVVPGTYRYVCYAVVGTLDDVQAGFTSLLSRTRGPMR